MTRRAAAPPRPPIGAHHRAARSGARGLRLATVFGACGFLWSLMAVGGPPAAADSGSAIDVPGVDSLAAIDCAGDSCIAVGQAPGEEGVVVPISAGTPGQPMGVDHTQNLNSVALHHRCRMRGRRGGRAGIRRGCLGARLEQCLARAH